MSAYTAQAGVGVAPSRQPGRPARARLTPVPARAVAKARPKVAYAIVVLAGVFCIVAAQLLLSVGLSQGAYELSALQDQKTELGWQKQSLADEVEQISSPQYIAANAQALGMVIGGTPAYLRLSDSAIVGVPAAASTDAPLQLGPPSLVGNSLLDGVPLVTAPDQAIGSDGTDPGASDEPEKPATISLENGLPSPNTR